MDGIVLQTVAITFFGNLTYFTGYFSQRPTIETVHCSSNSLQLAQTYLFVDLWLLADVVLTLQPIRCSSPGDGVVFFGAGIFSDLA